MPEGRGEIARKGVHDIMWGREGRSERKRERERETSLRGVKGG